MFLEMTSWTPPTLPHVTDKTRGCSHCLSRIRPDIDLPNSHFLPHKWSAELIVFIHQSRQNAFLQDPSMWAHHEHCNTKQPSLTPTWEYFLLNYGVMPPLTPLPDPILSSLVHPSLWQKILFWLTFESLEIWQWKCSYYCTNTFFYCKVTSP